MDARTAFTIGVFSALLIWPLVWIIVVQIWKFLRDWLWGTPLIQVPGIVFLWLGLQILKSKHVKQYMYEGRLYISPNSKVFGLRDGTREGPI